VATSLVSLANERGGPDNITVIAARFDGPGLPILGDDGAPRSGVVSTP
jgi:serine/threonine protein phosphatase PrpC